MLTILRQLLEQQQIRPLSFFFARFIAAQCEPEGSDLAALSAALVCERNQEGDVCIHLDSYAGQAVFPAAGPSMIPRPVAPAVTDWKQSLSGLNCVGPPGSRNPLILEDNRLYLGKYWHAEQQVAAAISFRIQNPVAVIKQDIQDRLAVLFPAAVGNIGANDQQLAAAIALRHRFAVISGGPGTGKTTTVYRLLVLLLQQQPTLRIAMAAPTGKAAARLLKALQEHKTADPAMSASSGIPQQTHTLHGLLGFNGRSYRHHRTNPLPLDCLIVDEASMIDLSLMAQLFDALPATARLILLGDRDQLAAIEAGNVLGDITGHGLALHYSSKQQQYLQTLGLQLTPTADKPSPAIADSIALLQTSYRFQADAGIGRLAMLVNQGQDQAALNLLQHDNSGQLQWLSATGQHLQKPVMDWILDAYSRYLGCQNITTALEEFEQIRILTALHEGPFGERELNRQIHARLLQKKLVGEAVQCRGMPVMILKNDYELGLFNGDTGMLWEDESNQLRAWFRSSEQSLRAIPLASLPAHCPAWALTVHKSQGSEFAEVLLLLPDSETSPVLSRELIYTGLTRARHKVLIHSSEQAFRHACRRRVQRSSGLAERLGWPKAQ